MPVDEAPRLTPRYTAWLMALMLAACSVADGVKCRPGGWFTNSCIGEYVPLPCGEAVDEAAACAILYGGLRRYNYPTGPACDRVEVTPIIHVVEVKRDIVELLQLDPMLASAPGAPTLGSTFLDAMRDEWAPYENVTGLPGHRLRNVFYRRRHMGTGAAVNHGLDQPFAQPLFALDTVTLTSEEEGPTSMFIRRMSWARELRAALPDSVAQLNDRNAMRRHFPGLERLLTPFYRDARLGRALGCARMHVLTYVIINGGIAEEYWPDEFSNQPSFQRVSRAIVNLLTFHPHFRRMVASVDSYPVAIGAPSHLHKFANPAVADAALALLGTVNASERVASAALSAFGIHGVSNSDLFLALALTAVSVGGNGDVAQAGADARCSGKKNDQAITHCVESCDVYAKNLFPARGDTPKLYNIYYNSYTRWMDTPGNRLYGNVALMGYDTMVPLYQNCYVALSSAHGAITDSPQPPVAQPEYFSDCTYLTLVGLRRFGQCLAASTAPLRVA